MNLSSTLVETVSIDYDDFNESFLTCSTCLCNYDAAEHNPKLLPCSHTICLECLTRIVATFARDSQFRYCNQRYYNLSLQFPSCIFLSQQHFIFSTTKL